MQAKKITLSVVFIFSTVFSFADRLDSVQVINEVSVTAKRSDFLVGSKLVSLDSVMLETISGQNLSEAITENFPIYVKQNASGLATIQIRGTRPDHTAILFNGININSLTLGHSNVAGIPMFFFDEVKLQMGSSSSLYGTDAIGGSIHLNNIPEWGKGISAKIQQEAGSFGSYFTGLKLRYGGKKLHYSLKAIQKRKENNFPFTHTTIRDKVSGGFLKDTTKNSRLNYLGIMQEIYYKYSKKLALSCVAWYQDNWHEIQTEMASNLSGDDFKEIQNNHLRVFTDVDYTSGNHQLMTRFSYVNDYQRYNNNYNEIIATHSFSTDVTYEKNMFLGGKLSVGGVIDYVRPNVYAYDSENITSEYRSDIFLGFKRNVGARINFAFNLREAFVSNYDNQFTPSFGVDYLASYSGNHSLKLKGSFGTSYKVPTLNDRYWGNQGKQDLLPEKGKSIEVNSIFKFFPNENFRLSSDLSFYLMNVDNLIVWDIVKIVPENFKSVGYSGMEFSANSECKLSEHFSLSVGGNYAFNKVVQLESYDDPEQPSSDNPGSFKKLFQQLTYNDRQLMYTPKHLGNVFISAKLNGWRFKTSGSYTGLRFTKEEGTDHLEAYTLLNTSLEKNVSVGVHRLSIHFKVNNVFNKSYQNWKNYAMYGRNYMLSINYFYN